MRFSTSLCALAIGALLGCGGTTRIGSTGDGDRPEPGGAPADSGVPGTGGSSIAGRGGRPDAGGRSSGGALASGGSVASGGRVASGGAPAVDASIDSGGEAGRVFDAGSDPERNLVPPGHVCDRLTTIQCAGEAFCCPLAHSLEACKQAMQGSCQQYLDAWSANPALGYDVKRAQAAFAEFEKRASVCDPTIMAWALSNEGFRGVARGTVPLGERCLAIDAGSVPVEAVSLIGSCAEPEANACMYTADNTRWFCAPRGTIGVRCFTDMNCVEGLYCDLATPMSTCADRRPNGAGCSWMLQCESMNCMNGFCAPATAESAYCLRY